MTERLENLFFEPCDGELSDSEGRTTFGVRYLALTCSCGKLVGTHLLKDESEIRWPHCERVITREMAIDALSDLVLCHRKGVWYDTYMGFWEDGSEMTDEEFEPVRERLDS